MTALGSLRLLPLLRCQHAALCAGRSRTLSSALWQPLARQSSAAKPLQNQSSTQLEVFRPEFRTPSLSRFSTAVDNAQGGGRSNESTVKRVGNNQTRANDEVGGKQNEEVNDFDLPNDPKMSITQKFRENLKKYWYVMVPVHLVTSSAYFLCFCYLASKGFSPIPLLEKLGLFKEYLQTVKDSHFTTIAVAVVFQKLAAPLRLVTTWYTTRALAWRGKLLTSSEFFLVVKTYLKKKIQGK